MALAQQPVASGIEVGGTTPPPTTTTSPGHDAPALPFREVLPPSRFTLPALPLAIEALAMLEERVVGDRALEFAASVLRQSLTTADELLSEPPVQPHQIFRDVPQFLAPSVAEQRLAEARYIADERAKVIQDRDRLIADRDVRLDRMNLLVRDQKEVVQSLYVRIQCLEEDADELGERLALAQLDKAEALQMADECLRVAEEHAGETAIYAHVACLERNGREIAENDYAKVCAELDAERAYIDGLAAHCSDPALAAALARRATITGLAVAKPETPQIPASVPAPAKGPEKPWPYKGSPQQVQMACRLLAESPGTPFITIAAKSGLSKDEAIRVSRNLESFIAHLSQASSDMEVNRLLARKLAEWESRLAAFGRKGDAK